MKRPPQILINIAGSDVKEVPKTAKSRLVKFDALGVYKKSVLEKKKLIVEEVDKITKSAKWVDYVPHSTEGKFSASVRAKNRESFEKQIESLEARRTSQGFRSSNITFKFNLLERDRGAQSMTNFANLKVSIPSTTTDALSKPSPFLHPRMTNQFQLGLQRPIS